MRLKIIAGNLVAVLLVAVVSYVVTRGQLESAIGARLDAEVDDDRTLFDRSWRLSASEFVERTADGARTDEVRDVFGGLDVDSRRRRAHAAANRISQWFADPSRGRAGAPDVVVVTDETGTVLARDTDPNRMFQRKLARRLGTLRQTLSDGTPRHDVWVKEDERKVLQTAMAPIRNETGTILGALVVGYELSNGLAANEAAVLGREVAFIAEGHVYGSSLSRAQVDGLQAALFDGGPLVDETARVLAAEGAVAGPWRLELGDDRFDGITASLPLSPSTDVAFVLLVNRSAAMAPASATLVILLMGLIGVVLVVVYGFVLGGALTRPIEQLEEGVLAIINGHTERRLDIESNELGGLASMINQLVNVFTGTVEEDAEGRVSSPPSPPQAFGEAWAAGGEASPAAAAAPPRPAPAAAGGGDVIDDPGIASALAAEDEEAYFERIFREYIAAKQSLNEDVSKITKERFIQRLQGNQVALAKKHGCRMVRFQVETRGGQVALKTVLIR